MSLRKVIIYTDGSCLVNPGGASGWAFCAVDGDVLTVCSLGYVESPENTNNRMELLAIIEGISTVRKGCECHVYTDSQWAMKGALKQNKRRANLDLWQRYDEVVDGKTVEFTWVKAHKGDVLNEFVDKLARQEARKNEKYKS